MTSTDSHIETIREVIDESLSDVGIDSERDVLFGSQARGDYTEESGVDISSSHLILRTTTVSDVSSPSINSISVEPSVAEMVPWVAIRPDISHNSSASEFSARASSASGDSNSISAHSSLIRGV